LPFFFPNDVIEGYTWMARLGSGVFLVIQMVILLDFAFFWNESWVAKEHMGWIVGLLVSTLMLYACSIALTVYLYKWFNPAGEDCSRNLWLISVAVVLCVIFTAICMCPMAKEGSLLPSAVITSYCIYLCYSALSSEPSDYHCNPHAQHHQAKPTMIASTVLTLLSVVYSALRAGTSDFFGGMKDSEQSDFEALQGAETGGGPMQGGDADSDDEDNGKAKPTGPVSYSYSFFHFIFAVACMYLAMLMTGWGTHSRNNEEQVDVGWASVWVKFASLWVTAGLYTWSLVAPALMPDREFL